MVTILKRLLPALLILAAAGCDNASPEARFQALENRLLESTRVDLKFHVTSQGAFEADIRGTLGTDSRGAVQLTGTGEFGGLPVDLSVQTLESGRFRFGNSHELSEAETPPHLRTAVLIGLTRMGILHNLARLAGGSPPDHAEGGVRDWVQVGGFTADSLDAASISFDLTVNGTPSGSADLQMDDRGLPVVRRQTVQFAEGVMRVVERYSEVAVEP